MDPRTSVVMCVTIMKSRSITYVVGTNRWCWLRCRVRKHEEACDEPCDSGYSVRRPYEWTTERRPSRILVNVADCSCCINKVPLCILISYAEDSASRFT